ncbi:MAG: hypothetical protein FWG66_06580 [Spirochaetes bacterium]|nr:hypothetical protein [Spirochaetota bacterium]
MPDTNAQNEHYLLERAPLVLRARGFRLYGDGGVRLVDLWQNNGAAVLGHRPPSLLRELKNTAGRGLYAPFPHFMEGRLKNALGGLFPGRVFRFYCGAPFVLQALVKTGEAALWRPFSDAKSPFAVAEDAPGVLIPVLPGIQGWRGGLPLGFCALALRPEAADGLPPGEFLPPLSLAAAARGARELLASGKRAKPGYRRIERALQKSPWSRRGIYLGLKEPLCRPRWEALFARFLQAGFLLPPVPSDPLILPGELSDGEEAALAKLLQS